MVAISLVAGTRPEIIKLAPVDRLLRRRHPGAVRWIATGQHGLLASQALDEFGICPESKLRLARDAGDSRRTDMAQLPRQQGSIAGVLSELIEHLDAEFARNPCEMVVVQGDTNSTLAAALAAFSRGIPVAHVEAGLRTFNPQRPFPEETWRTLVSQIAELHFAPTGHAAENLQACGVPSDRIFVTGNTVIDSLHWIMRKSPCADIEHICARPGRIVLATLHRRENWSGPVSEICRALRALCDTVPDIRVYFIAHGNRALRRVVEERLAGTRRIEILDPLSYSDFVHLMKRSALVLSDSGGVQEEAPVLGVPVLVLRDATERPEAVEQGAALLVGTEPARIVASAAHLLTDEAAYRAMARPLSLYGDGHASDRIAGIIESRLAREGSAPSAGVMAV